MPFEHFSQVTVMDSSNESSVLSYFACCIFHIISILFNCIRVAKVMMGTKVVPLYFMFALFLESRATTRAEDLRPFLIS